MAEIGGSTVFAVQFLNASGAVTAPTTVQLRLREELDGTELYWDLTPTTPAGANAIAGSGGNYTMTWVHRKAERISVQWTGAGNGVNQSNVQTVLVRHSPIAALEVSPSAGAPVVANSQTTFLIILTIGSGGSVTVTYPTSGVAAVHASTGIYTLTMPPSSSQFVGGVEIIDPGAQAPIAHIDSISSGACQVNTGTNFTNNVDPSSGAKIYLELLLNGT